MLMVDVSLMARKHSHAMNDISQETVEVTPEIAVVMAELGLPGKRIRIGMDKGYEARLIDPDGKAEPGNVIWALSSHIAAFQDYMDREVAGAFEDARRAATI